LNFDILFASVLNGLTTGAVYALVALGLTLIYGVLHIINFAHGAALMVALYAVYLLKAHLGIDPYLALPIVVPGMFGLGYALQRGIINGPATARMNTSCSSPWGSPSCSRTWRCWCSRATHARSRRRTR